MDDSYAKDKAPDDQAPESGEDDSQTLISKDILPKGCKEGDSYTFKVVSDFGDEVGVKLVEDNEKTETETPSTDEAEIDSMDKEGM